MAHPTWLTYGAPASPWHTNDAIGGRCALCDTKSHVVSEFR
jgi:hypothetical protein